MAKIRGTTGVGATIAPASNKAKYKDFRRE